MRKLIFMLVILLFILAGCSNPQPGNNQPGTSAPPAGSPSASNSALLPSAPSTEGWTKADMPRIDGSTATIPLSEGIAKALLKMTDAEATAYIHHNTTHNAYVNLLDGKCDIIFVTPPSADELALAQEKGIELEVVPVVREGFIFLINKSNPITSLTLEQLQNIYEGKTTNWKELGGPDMAIVPYQRPENSGSQTLFLDLVMKGKNLMKPPTDLVAQGMGDLVEEVASYETGKASLGYSVFYYATDMYVRDGAKLLAVNGVMPGKKTISSGQYPLLSAYYAVLRKDAPQDSPARKLLAWVLGNDGQKTADASGYVTLKPLN